MNRILGIALAIVQQLETIVGTSAGIYSYPNLPAFWKGRIAETVTPETEIDCFVCPQTSAQLSEVMALAYRQNLRVLCAGAGTKLHWGGLAEKVDVVLSTAKLNRLIDHAAGDMTVTAESGMKFSDLQAILAQKGQFLPLDVPFAEEATLGGIVATAITGSLRHRYGGVRDLLIGLSFVRSDGEIAKAGGRVVKNVAGYDLMKLFTGSHGTLGVICQVTFRVYPLPDASQTVVLTGEKAAIAEAAKTLMASALTPTAMDVLSPAIVAQLNCGDGMGLLVRFQSVAESVRQQSDRLLEVGKMLSLKGHTLTDDSDLWQQLKNVMWNSEHRDQILCKIGVRPSNAVEALAGFDSLNGSGVIHAGSGLGVLRLEENSGVETVEKLRKICEEKGGFLTILQGAVSLKQKCDVWGYKGNGLEVMKKIKTQFDAKNILSAGRFVGGI